VQEPFFLSVSPGVQYSAVVYSYVTNGTFKEVLAALPTSPRLAVGRFFGSPAPDADWAVTFVSSNWNGSSAVNQGPQFIMDNVTLWAAPTFSDALPMVRAAFSAMLPPVFCWDVIAGKGRCMHPNVVANFQAPRSSLAVFGAQYGSPPATARAAAAEGSAEGTAEGTAPTTAILAPSSPAVMSQEGWKKGWVVALAAALAAVLLGGAHSHSGLCRTLAVDVGC
jgi:hypothetical protein